MVWFDLINFHTSLILEMLHVKDGNKSKYLNETITKFIAQDFLNFAGILISIQNQKLGELFINVLYVY